MSIRFNTPVGEWVQLEAPEGWHSVDGSPLRARMWGEAMEVEFRLAPDGDQTLPVEVAVPWQIEPCTIIEAHDESGRRFSRYEITNHKTLILHEQHL